MNNTHIHTASCLAVNELNETCCSEMTRVSADACRRTVTFRHPTNLDYDLDVHTFTDDDADAIALARALHPTRDACVIEITFRDLDHQLDDLAHPSYIRDVDNPTD